MSDLSGVPVCRTYLTYLYVGLELLDGLVDRPVRLVAVVRLCAGRQRPHVVQHLHAAPRVVRRIRSERLQDKLQQQAQSERVYPIKQVTEMLVHVVTIATCRV